MIEYEKRTEFCYSCAGRHRIELNSEADLDLAARILDAFQWADDHDAVTTKCIDEDVYSAHFDDGTHRGPICYGKSRLEAIEALRAKVEPAMTESSKLMRDKTDEYDDKTAPDKRVPDFRPTCIKCGEKWPDFAPIGVDAQEVPCPRCRTPDKRVPAELWRRLMDQMRVDGPWRLHKALEACPDIVDEDEYLKRMADAAEREQGDEPPEDWDVEEELHRGATLHPTAQAVFEAPKVEKWRLCVVKKLPGYWTVVPFIDGEPHGFFRDELVLTGPECPPPPKGEGQ